MYYKAEPNINELSYSDLLVVRDNFKQDIQCRIEFLHGEEIKKLQSKFKDEKKLQIENQEKLLSEFDEIFNRKYKKKI